MYLLFNFAAAIPVVLLPQNGSKIKSFSFVDANIILSKISKGFCVGCLPCFFSDGFVKDINSFVNIGETIRVRVIDSDDDTFHVKLSIKDLNYRIEKRKKTYIPETINGFNTLEKQLKIWIEDKEKEKKQKTL